MIHRLGFVGGQLFFLSFGGVSLKRFGGWNPEGSRTLKSGGVER